MDQQLNWRKAHSSQMAGRPAINGLVYQDETGAFWMPGPSGNYEKQGSGSGGGNAAVVTITASDAGSAWATAPALLSLAAVLNSGAATTVLIEARDSLGTVATVATITCDTVGEVLRQAILMRQQSEYRVRRSSGTGNVSVTI